MANWIENGPCDLCGSKDNRSQYDDGSSWCHTCPPETALQKDGDVEPIEVSPNLLPVQSGELVKRKLNTQTCTLWGYGTTEYGGRQVQVAQFRSSSGCVVAQKLRLPGKEFLWVGSQADSLPLYGQHLWAKHPNKKLIITEGELDAMSVSQAQQNKWPVVSLRDGAASAEKCIKAAMDYVCGFKEVVLLFDQDEPGQEAAQLVAALLPPGYVKIASFDLKDASDLLQAGRAPDIIKAIFEAETYRPDSILVGSELLEHLFRERPPSADYFHAGLNEKLGGIRKKEITLACAGSGIGKTTFCQEQTYSLIEQGFKVGLVYLEQAVQVTLLNILSIPLNTRLKLLKDLPKEQLIEALGKIQQNICVYNHFGTKDPDRLMSELRYMIMAEGCDFIVFDHISIVISGQKHQNERQDIDYLMSTLRSLVEETGAGVLLVSHLKRAGKDGEGFSAGRVPRLEDLRGSSTLEGLSDIIIGLARNMRDNDNEVRTIVLKDRWIGNTGMTSSLTFDTQTGRLVGPLTPFDKDYD